MPQASNSTANSLTPLLRVPISGQPTPLTFLPHLRLQTALPATLLLAIGCASPGPPRPPSLKLPQLVTDLTAQRVGDQILLQWTTPTRTTDNLPIKGTLTARICRTPITSTPNTPKPPQPAISTQQLTTNNQQPATPCPAVFTLPVHPGASAAADTLPQPSPPTPPPSSTTASRSTTPLATPPARPIPPTPPPAPPHPLSPRFAPPPSKPASCSSGPHPRPPPRRPQLQLTWNSIASTSPSPPPANSRPKPSPALRNPSKPLARNPPKSTSAPEPPLSPREPSDQTAHFGDLYRYTAQRIRSATLSGHSLELRSIISAPITIPLRDTFPPATPTGLYAVPGQTTATTDNQQLTANNLVIDLSWQPNTEPDLAGYIVYRRQLPSPNSTAPAGTAPNGTPPTRLTPTPLPGPAYRDPTAIPGQTYAYSITAIDTSGNESKPTPEVQETLPQP